MRAREFLITESKNSDRYYHGTRKDLDGFRPLTHFGTFRAAYDRLLDTNTGSNTKNQKIYQVTLDIKNPVELQDISKNHKLSDWISMMKLQEYITSEEAESISTPRQLIKLLINKGYDGINYMNEWEDPGSDSYVIFKPEQVKIKDVITFDQQRKITRLLKEVIKKSDTSKAEQWIKKVYSKLQPHPFNRDEYIMGFSPEEFAVIKLSPSKFGKETDVVYVDWFQAYPLGAGVGQKAMKILQKMAAEDDISLALFPWAKGKISQKSLVKFYKKQGFTTGKRGSTMTWRPVKQGVAEGSGDTIEIPSGKSKLVKRTIPRYWYHSLHGRELGSKGEILPYKYGKETKIFQDELFRDPKPNGFVYLSPQPLASDSIKIDASKLDPSLMRLTGQVEGYAIYAGAIPAEAQVEDKSLTEAKVKPITAYHGTRRKITKFEPFTHFGSPQAAKDRLDHTLYGSEEGAEKDMIYKVKLNISNPMKLFGDYDKNHDLSVYKDLIADADHMTPDEYKNINSLDELKKFILSKGYDGLIYTNRYEGIGTKSYVILDPSQVTIEKVYKYPDTYKVKESVI